MKINALMAAALVFVLVVGAFALARVPQGTSGAAQGMPAVNDQKSPKRKDKVVKTDAEWKKQLTPLQYKILRNQGTEAAFCGGVYDNHKNGVYSCVGCGLPVFKSDAKFDSGTGWPSFFQPYAKDSVWIREDRSYGMVREEVLCARCDGHLGHVFDDGPKPSGLRFCINSEVLTFKETK